MTVAWLLALMAWQGPSLAELERRARADSNDAERHYALGVELARLKRGPEARQAFENAVLVDPRMIDALVALRRLTPTYDGPPFLFEVANGRYRFIQYAPSDTARHMSRRIFLLNPLVDERPGQRYPVPAFWRGTIQQAMRAYRAENWALAVAWLDSVVIKASRRPQDEPPPYALWYRAMASIELGRHPAAIEDLRRLLALALRDSTPRGRSETFRREYALAYVQQLSGDLAEAARIYRQLLDENFTLDLAHMHLANVLEALGRIDEALAERRTAVDVNPDDPSLVLDLGATLHRAGYHAEAAEVLRRSLAANPRDVRAHFVLGGALQAQGKADSARAAYQRFLDLAPRRYEALIADARRRLVSP